MKRYFDVAIIVPLDEEFEVVVEQFRFEEDLSSPTQIQFRVSLPGSPAQLLLIKQNAMGKTANQTAVIECLDSFNVGMFICVGIAGALSTDLCIGDVCYSQSIIDVLDNVKAGGNAKTGVSLSFQPTNYKTPTEVTVAISMDRHRPDLKVGYEKWRSVRGEAAIELIPNAFTGKNGRKEQIGKPHVYGGSIACAFVSGSPVYNNQLKDIDRKVLAIETESGGLFSVALAHNIPALTVRGISDYAGLDKNIFEIETNGKARILAVENAASYLARQLGGTSLNAYLSKLRAARGEQTQSLLACTPPPNLLATTLLKQEEIFDLRLRELAPAYSLLAKGYRLPVPRVRIIHDRLALNVETKREPMEVRDVLREGRVTTLHLPKEYPDLSIAWVIANDLLRAQTQEKQIIPCVVEARNLKRPRAGIAEIADKEVLNFVNDPNCCVTFLVDDFNFDSKSRSDFLTEQVRAFPKASFIILTRSRKNIILESEFCSGVSSLVASVCDVSFLEIAHFLQKNFEMPGPVSEVVATRLRETFSSYQLQAHPTYFAGIPKSTLHALLHANRRAELIELAVVGYLSFVVSQDMEPVALSRKTREKFLTNLAFEINVNKRKFSEEDLALFAKAFATQYDFHVKPVRFVSSFMEKSILHIDNGEARFTLPFIESYLLAKHLHENPKDAEKYFDIGSLKLDQQTFALYAEMGASERIIESAMLNLNEIIEELRAREKKSNILLENTIYPAFLARHESVRAVESRIKKITNDVTNDQDSSRQKQKFFDAADRVRAGAEHQAASSHQEDEEARRSIEGKAIASLLSAVNLLGAGAERLPAAAKRNLIAKIVKISSLIINDWTRDSHSIDYVQLKSEMISNEELVAKIATSHRENDVEEAKKFISELVDFVEQLMLSAPFLEVLRMLCEEARDNVLAESIANTDVDGAFEELLRGLWLVDVDVERGRPVITKSFKALPNAMFLRHTVASHILVRVFWNHWRKEDRLSLLQIANGALKATGQQYDKAMIRRIIADDKKAGAS